MNTKAPEGSRRKKISAADRNHRLFPYHLLVNFQSSLKPSNKFRIKYTTANKINRSLLQMILHLIAEDIVLLNGCDISSLLAKNKI